MTDFAPPAAESLNVVVYGIINAGKSSLINALTDQDARAVGPIGGTTAEVVATAWHWSRTLAVGGEDQAVRLIDTPGLEEVDQAGQTRGELATEAAEAADLILFVLAEDLTATARAALVALHRAGKPMVVVVNKVDLLDPTEQDEILDAIRAGLAGIIPPEHLVTASAAPIVRRRVEGEAGRPARVETVRGEPDVTDLERLMGAVLAGSSADLRALAAARDDVERHVATRTLEQRDRRILAERVADETSAGLALALAVNPIPLLDFLTGSGGLVILVHRVAAVYDEPMTPEMARGLAGDLVRGGRVVLWGALATTIAGGAMKLIPGLGHLAGALSQGASAGYFGHVVGRALVTYLENGKDWGDGGLVAELDRVAALTDRKAITRGLIDQIKGRLRR